MNLKYEIAVFKRKTGDGFYDELYFMETNDVYEAEFYGLCLASAKFTTRFIVDEEEEYGAGWIRIKWY